MGDDMLDLSNIQMGELIGGAHEEGSLTMNQTLVLMADASGKAGAMSQDMVADFIHTHAKKGCLVTYVLE